MTENLPVVAAIPNYNMGEALSELLPQVLEQEYAEVYVLDDASTDESMEILRDFGDDVRVVAGKENVGAGGNRNRIIPALGHEAIIHFLDADMELETERTPEVAQELAADSNLAFIGGLIKTNRGHQHFYNYGPRQCLHTDLTAIVQTAIGAINNQSPERAAALRNKFADILSEWPNPFEEPVARRTFWAVESNLIIRPETFRRIGGYDPRLRYHEVQDLAKRFEKVGLKREFSPLIATIHKAVSVRGEGPVPQMARAELQLIRKHGLLEWLLPNGQFKP